MLKYMKLAVFLYVLTCFIGMPALHAAWVDNGIAVCTIPDTQDLPVPVSDGSGGAIIVWRDNRTVNTDIYAQRVDADGNILWIIDAMPVCTAINFQSDPIIISDGSGGAIITWQDARSGASDIYAQKINSGGYIQWPANGVAICTGQSGLLLGDMISDGAGGAIITWHDRRSFSNDIYIQRIGTSGTVQWTANGVTITALLNNQENPTLASDGAGGAIITWQDARDGAADIYAQRVNASGNVQWTADGIVVCNAGDPQIYPRIVSDGVGGAIIAWSDRRNTLDYDIFAQRVDANGNPLWTANGEIISQTMRHQRYCRLVPCGSSDAIITWEDSRSGIGTDIYAQRVDAGGTPQWVSNGVVVCTATGDQLNVQLIPNGSGGAVVTWEDGRNGNIDVYAQSVNTSGTAAWTADGVAICTTTGDQTTPQLAPDGWGGAIIPWSDQRNGNFDIFSQRIDAAGHTVTATFLETYSAALSGSDIKIEWTLSEAGEDIDFFILRASEPSMAFGEISSAGIRRDGLSYSFIDDDCEPATTYYYRVDVRDDGERKILFETGPIETPAVVLTLYQNLPNPFNPSTTIRYYVAERCHVILDVYGVSGDLVKRLVDGNRADGLYTAVWNGCDKNGRQMSSGVYFYRLKAGKEVLSRKMILLR